MTNPAVTGAGARAVPADTSLHVSVLNRSAVRTGPRNFPGAPGDPVKPNSEVSSGLPSHSEDYTSAHTHRKSRDRWDFTWIKSLRVTIPSDLSQGLSLEKRYSLLTAIDFLSASRAGRHVLTFILDGRLISTADYDSLHSSLTCFVSTHDVLVISHLKDNKIKRRPTLPCQ